MDNNQAENLTSLWRDWCNKFLALPQHPMDGDTAKVFMVCSLAELRDQSGPLMEGFTRSFMGQLIANRSKYMELQITDSLKFMVGALSENPGTVVMYLNVLKYASLTSKDEVLGMDHLARLFPCGFPSEESLQSIWEAQKGYNLDRKFDNLLDAIPVRLMK